METNETCQSCDCVGCLEDTSCILPDELKTDITDEDIDDIINKILEDANFTAEDVVKFFDVLYKDIYCKIEAEYKKNRISGEEFSRFVFDAMMRLIELSVNAKLQKYQAVLANIPNLINLYTLKWTLEDQILSQRYTNLLSRYQASKIEKECKLTDKQAELTCEQVKGEYIKNGSGDVNCSIYKKQKDILDAQRKLYYQQRKSFYNGDRIKILSEMNKAWISGMSEQAEFLAVTHSELKEKMDTLYKELWSERDYQPNGNCLL